MKIVRVALKCKLFLHKYVKRFRTWRARMIAPNISKDAVVENHAKFTSEICVGKNSAIGIRAYLMGEIYIGENVMMGPDCQIFTRNHKFDRCDIPMVQQGSTEQKPVYIDDDVWIGSRVTILAGVHISRGAVIGAGSVVTHDVPEFAVVGGVPARIIKFRKDKTGIDD